MSKPTGPTYGRAAMFGVLIALLLAIGVGVYMVLARFGSPTVPMATAADAAEEENQRLARLSAMLTILLISTLLILLFVIGCYLVMFVGRVLRKPVADKPTNYVDAWRQYRLTDEEIAAATAEHPRDDPQVDRGDPDEPPENPDSEHS